MGEVLILIIIALAWGFKAAVANEKKRSTIGKPAAFRHHPTS